MPLTCAKIWFSGSARAGGGATLFQKENNMKSSIRDRAEGVGRQAKGKAKEVAGRATNNPDLEGEGMGEQIAGTAQRKVGQVKKVFGH